MGVKNNNKATPMAPIHAGCMSTTDKNEIIETGIKMIDVVFEEVGIEKELIIDDCASAAYSHSGTLNPEPTKEDKKLQENVVQTFDAKGFEGKAMLGIMSCIMLNAKGIVEGSIDEELFLEGITKKVAKEQTYRFKRVEMKNANTGVTKNFITTEEIFARPAEFKYNG